MIAARSSHSLSPCGLLRLCSEFLRESDCVPDTPVFHQLVTSMTSAINSQARASFSASTFLRQIRRETLVSHLPAATHASVKHALLSSPSTSSLFLEGVEVKEDSEIFVAVESLVQEGWQEVCLSFFLLGSLWLLLLILSWVLSPSSGDQALLFAVSVP